MSLKWARRIMDVVSRNPSARGLTAVSPASYNHNRSPRRRGVGSQPQGTEDPRSMPKGTFVNAKNEKQEIQAPARSNLPTEGRKARIQLYPRNDKDSNRRGHGRA